MNEAEIREFITATFEGVEIETLPGMTFFFYGPGRKMPFATLVSADMEGDRLSRLDRPDVFRLNVGVSHETFRSLFGSHQGLRHAANSGYDFAERDRLLPHPVYSAQSWLCVLNPSQATFERAHDLLAEAYERAARRESRRREAPGGA
jgi:hypothetical protein